MSNAHCPMMSLPVTPITPNHHYFHVVDFPSIMPLKQLKLQSSNFVYG